MTFEEIVRVYVGKRTVTISIDIHDGETVGLSMPLKKALKLAWMILVATIRTVLTPHD